MEMQRRTTRQILKSTYYFMNFQHMLLVKRRKYDLRIQTVIISSQSDGIRSCVLNKYFK